MSYTILSGRIPNEMSAVPLTNLMKKKSAATITRIFVFDSVRTSTLNLLYRTEYQYSIHNLN